MKPKLCDLHTAAGRIELCPGERCAFWDRESCVVAGLKPDLSRNPELLHLLLGLRNRVEGQADAGPSLLPGLGG